MPDWVMAGMEWMCRSGEEDKRWEVAKKRVAVWIKKYRYPLREVPVAPDCLAVPHLPVPCHYDGLRRLAVLRFYVFDGGYGSLLRPCRVLLAVQDHLSGL